jgi:hypothetical protein
VSELLEAKDARIASLENQLAVLAETANERIAQLEQALRAVLSELDKAMRYGSPIAIAANERLAFARKTLEG